MKKEIVKNLVVSLTYCCEGLVNGNKSLMAIIITFVCIMGRSFILRERKIIVETECEGK